MGRCWAGLFLMASLVTVAPVVAGAADKLPPVRYVDGTILTWDSRTGANRWVAKPGRGRYLQVGAVGRSVVVAMSGRCRDDDRGLERTRPVAFDARTGRLRWRSDGEGIVVAGDTGNGIVVVLLPNKDQVIGLSAKTGHRKWTVSTGLPTDTSPTTVFVRTTTASTTTLDARDRATGRSRWTFTAPRAGGPGYGVSVLASDGRYTAIAGVTASGAATLYSLDSTTGREVSRTVVDLGLYFSKAVLHDGVLALINGTEIDGIDLASGTIVWRHPVERSDSNIRGTLTSGLSGRVAIFSAPTRRGTIALDTATGATLWSRPTLGSIGNTDAASTVLLAPLRTYTEEPIEGVDIATGRTRWTRTLRSAYAVPAATLRQPGFAVMSVVCGTP